MIAAGFLFEDSKKQRARVRRPIERTHSCRTNCSRKEYILDICDYVFFTYAGSYRLPQQASPGSTDPATQQLAH